MYGKVFSQIYDGTLGTTGPWEALVTFQQLIILADKNGEVDMTAGALAKRTSIPLTIIETGIAELLKPDPESRSPAEEGRRIVPLSDSRSWGWKIVNYAHYRALRTQEERREYHRQYGIERRAKAKVDIVDDQQSQHNQPGSTNSSKQRQKQEEQKPSSPADAGDRGDAVPDCPHNEIIKLYHDILPELAPVRVWGEDRQALLRKRWREDKERQTLEWWKGYFEFVRTCPHLMGNNDRGWETTLEWLVRPKNMPKVLEGNYQEKKRGR